MVYRYISLGSKKTPEPSMKVKGLIRVKFCKCHNVEKLHDNSVYIGYR